MENELTRAQGPSCVHRCRRCCAAAAATSTSAAVASALAAALVVAAAVASTAQAASAATEGPERGWVNMEEGRQALLIEGLVASADSAS